MPSLKHKQSKFCKGQRGESRLKKGLNDKEIGQVLDIMEESFPPFERRNREGQLALFDAQEYRAEIIKENDEVVGFVVYWQLDSCVFVENLAVDEKKRGSGIGALLVKRVIDEGRMPIILEVEPIEDDLTARRVKFYERLGFELCDIHDYEQPPLQEGMGYNPLMVMGYPKAFSKEEFSVIKAELYKKIYKVEEEK